MTDRRKDSMGGHVRPRTTFLPCRQRPTVWAVLGIVLITVCGIPTVTAVNNNNSSIGDNDWASLNRVLESLTIAVDETAVLEQDVAGAPLTIVWDDMVCRGLSFGDVTIDWSQGADSPANNDGSLRIDNRVTLHSVGIDCTLQYNYSYLLFGGAGSLELQTAGSTLQTATNIVTTTDSTNSNEPSPMVSVNMTSCTADILIEDLQFNGEGLGLLGSALNAMDDWLRQTVADRMASYVCSLLGQFQAPLQTGLADFFQSLTVRNPRPYQPLQVEANLRVPRSVRLLNLQNPQANNNNNNNNQAMDPTMIANMLLQQLTDYVTAMSSNGDLQWNQMLRDTLLDAETATLDISVATLLPGQGRDSPNTGNGLVLLDTDTAIGNYTLQFSAARLKGLDSFTRIDPLQPIGRFTLETLMALDHITIQLEGLLRVAADKQTLTEPVVLELTLRDVSFSLALLLGVDLNTLGQVPLGALLDQAQTLPCLASSLYRLKSTGLQFRTMTLDPPVLSGLASPGLQRVLSDSLKALFRAHDPLLSTLLPRLMESTVTDLLDQTLTTWTGQQRNQSSCPVAQGSNAFVDFRDLLLPPAQAKEYGASGTAPYGELGVLVKDFVKEQLLQVNPRTGRTGLAEMFIVPMTRNQSGTAGSLALPDVVSFAGNIQVGEDMASLALHVGDVRMDHLDSIGAPMSLLDPMHQEAHRLNNSVTFGVPPEPVQLKATVLVELSKQDKRIHNDMTFSVGLNSATAVLEMFMKASEQSIMRFPLQDLLVWDCWLASIPAPELDAYGVRLPHSEPTLSLPKLAMSIAAMNFTVQCNNCSSSKMEEFAALISSDALNAQVFRSATNMINGLLETIAGPSSFLQTTLDRLLVDAAKFCPHNPAYDPNATKTSFESLAVASNDNSNLDYMIALLSTMLAIIVLSTVFYQCLRCVVVSRHRRWLATLPPQQLMSVYENDQREKADEAAINTSSASLFRSKEIPLAIRVLTPLVLIGNIALFLSGHFSKGGTVELHVNVGGETVAFTDFYSFSIAQSGVELWTAGYRPLAILMLITAGIWPYLKQLITISLWFLPPQWVSTSTRGRILLVLDYLAKWSEVDVFVMIVCLAAFRVQVQSPDLAFVPDNLYQIDILVVPVWGLYANMLAQLLSQVTSHFIIGYHRLVVYKARKHVASKRRDSAVRVLSTSLSDAEAGPYMEDENSKVLTKLPTASTDSESGSDSNQLFDDYPLSQHAFTRPHRGESGKLVVRSGVNVGLVVVTLVALALTVLGCSLPLVSFDYRGIVGIAVESGQNFQEAKEYISVFSLTRLLMDQARFLDTAKDMVGMLSVSIVLIYSTFLVPLALLSVLLVEWFHTHSLNVRRRLRTTVEILQAWQYIEVLVLSVIVGAWQIGDVSELLLDDYCGGGLGGTLSELALLGLVKPEDARCFRVQAAIEPACFILVAAGVVIVALSTFVSMAVAQRTRDENRAALGRYASPSLDDLDDPKKVKFEEIAPFPVLFTDQFRWLLRGHDTQTEGVDTFDLE